MKTYYPIHTLLAFFICSVIFASTGKDSLAVGKRTRTFATAPAAATYGVAVKTSKARGAVSVKGVNSGSKIVTTKGKLLRTALKSLSFEALESQTETEVFLETLIAADGKLYGLDLDKVKEANVWITHLEIEVRTNSNILSDFNVPNDFTQGTMVRIYRQDVYKTMSNGNGDLQSVLNMNSVNFQY